jgi:hypothetical protein
MDSIVHAQSHGKKKKSKLVKQAMILAAENQGHLSK